MPSQYNVGHLLYNCVGLNHSIKGKQCCYKYGLKPRILVAESVLAESHGSKGIRTQIKIPVCYETCKMERQLGAGKRDPLMILIILGEPHQFQNVL